MNMTVHTFIIHLCIYGRLISFQISSRLTILFNFTGYLSFLFQRSRLWGFFWGFTSRFPSACLLSSMSPYQTIPPCSFAANISSPEFYDNYKLRHRKSLSAHQGFASHPACLTILLLPEFGRYKGKLTSAFIVTIRMPLGKFTPWLGILPRRRILDFNVGAPLRTYRWRPQKLQSITVNMGGIR
jgi:hypothetical protein